MYKLLLLDSSIAIHAPDISLEYFEIFHLRTEQLALQCILEQKPDIILCHYTIMGEVALHFAAKLKSLNLSIPYFICCKDAPDDVNVTITRLGALPLKSDNYNDEVVKISIYNALNLPYICEGDCNKKEGEPLPPLLNHPEKQCCQLATVTHKTQ